MSQFWGDNCNSREVRKQLETFFASDERNTGKAMLVSGLELDSGLYKRGICPSDISPPGQCLSVSSVYLLSPRLMTIAQGKKR